MTRKRKIGAVPEKFPASEDLQRFTTQLIEGCLSDDEVGRIWDEISPSTDVLHKFRYDQKDLEDLNGRSILFIAIALQKYNLAKLVVQICPELIKESLQTEEAGGVTPFHLLVAFGETDLVRYVLFISGDKSVVKSEACGHQLEGTLFMGRLPLSIAAVRNNLDMVQLLLDFDADIFAQNMHGDTVLHSLVKFANCFPTKENNVKCMMRSLITLTKDETGTRLVRKDYDPQGEIDFTQSIGPDMQELIRMKNKQHRTVVQLATELCLTSILKLLLDANLRITVYDLAYEFRRYDVTEIEKGALIQIRRFQSGDNAVKKPESFSRSEQSVCELLCSRPLNIATDMIEHECIEEVIRRKWKHYRWFAAGFGVFHFVLLCLLCVYASAKSATIQQNGWVSDLFLLGSSVISMLVALLYLFMELILRTLVTRQPLSLMAIHHNSVHRLSQLLFSAPLLVDSILNLVNGVSSNIFLVFAILPGAWFQLCFLRCIPYIGTHIVLINQALAFALVPMAFLILFMLTVFSNVMFSLFQLPENNSDVNTEFETFGKTMLKMSNILVGISEIDNLLDSREDILVLFLYFVFLIVVSLLMINALISIMTNQFTPNYENRIQLNYLQKLSLSIFMEGILLPLWSCCSHFPFRIGKVFGCRDLLVWSRNRCILSFRKVRCDEHTRPSNIAQEKRFIYKSLEQHTENITSCISTLESAVRLVTNVRKQRENRGKSHYGENKRHGSDRDSEDDYFSRDDISVDMINREIRRGRAAEFHSEEASPSPHNEVQRWQAANSSHYGDSPTYHPEDRDLYNDIEHSATPNQPVTNRTPNSETVSHKSSPVRLTTVARNVKEKEFQDLENKRPRSDREFQNEESLIHPLSPSRDLDLQLYRENEFTPAPPVTFLGEIDDPLQHTTAAASSAPAPSASSTTASAPTASNPKASAPTPSASTSSMNYIPSAAVYNQDL